MTPRGIEPRPAPGYNEPSDTRIDRTLTGADSLPVKCCWRANFARAGGYLGAANGGETTASRAFGRFFAHGRRSCQLGGLAIVEDDSLGH